MNGIILCRTKTAKNPFYIANIDLRIYTLEELCYYIYNNIYLIGFDLVDADLIYFIRRELDEQVLASKLEYLHKNHAGLAEMVITLFKYVDYYDAADIEEIREILETLNTQNVYERLKKRADSLLDNSKYASAIKNYMKIIEADRDPILPGIFYAKVYHNMGVAYARLFLYKQAKKAFMAAYSIGQHEESKKCIVATEVLDENMYEPKTFGEDDEQSYIFEREIETVLDNALSCEECANMDRLEKEHENGNTGYYSQMSEIIENWKNEYTKFTS